MALVVIPLKWRQAVCTLLAKKPVWDPAGAQRFLNEYPNNWQYEAVEAMRTYLTQDEPKGCPVTMKTPGGETYEFFFQFVSQRAYGKILLRSNGSGLVIFSAHRPSGPKLRCE